MPMNHKKSMAMQEENQPHQLQLKSHRPARLEQLIALQRQRQALSELTASLDQQINELLSEFIPPGKLILRISLRVSVKCE